MPAEPTHSGPRHTLRDLEAVSHVDREWLVTNGLGGYASGTVGGAITRRYHGLLIAALPNPFGRMIVLNALSERLRLPDRRIFYTGAPELTDRSGEGALRAVEFRLEAGLPVWRFEADGLVFEKRLLMPYKQNTVHVTYKLIEGTGPVRLGLRPAVQFRPHDAPVDASQSQAYRLAACEDQYEIAASANMPVLRMKIDGKDAAFTFDRKLISGVFYRAESDRGYESHGSLWSPGYFRADLWPGSQTTLVASTEDWNTIFALTPENALASEIERRRLIVAAACPAAPDGPAAELVLAADQFLIEPAGRTEDAARARATGDQIRTVIAGYHWFTDWGRDTMISLEGLTLVTGRHDRSRLDSPHFRPLHPRRSDSEPVSRRREGRPLSHGRRHAVVLPRHSPLSGAYRRPRHAALHPAAAASRSSSATCGARASASASIPADGLLTQGAAKAISSPGWTPRWATGWSRRGAARPSRSTPSGTTPCA